MWSTWCAAPSISAVLTTSSMLLSSFCRLFVICCTISLLFTSGRRSYNTCRTAQTLHNALITLSQHSHNLSCLKNPSQCSINCLTMLPQCSQQCPRNLLTTLSQHNPNDVIVLTNDSHNPLSIHSKHRQLSHNVYNLLTMLYQPSHNTLKSLTSLLDSLS